VRGIEHPSAEALLAHAGPMLEANEVENALILGLLATPPKSTTASPTWMSLDGPEGPVGVAMRTPPFNLLLSRMGLEALDPLVTALAERGEALPGVTGPLETAQAFGDRWARRRDLVATVTMRQGLYELRHVVRPERMAPGALRAARAEDVELVATWMAGFAGDARLPGNEHEALRRSAEARISAGGVHIWDDAGAPVSMASLQGATPHGIRVSFVYTPPELRGRGYASACVATLSAQALASGRRFCTLYTDLTNPISNGIYRRIGYRAIGESAMVAFGGR
jgi:uncharacterized protein